MKQPAIIVDVNGTLGDTKERSHFLETEPRDWEGFFRHMAIDKPVDFVHRLVNAQHDFPFYCKIIMVTGAPEKYRNLMLDWFEKYDIKFDYLYMRPDFRFIKGFQFKKKLLEEDLLERFDIVVALEDKEECAQMYRSLGIPCWLTTTCAYPRRDKMEPEVYTRGRQGPKIVRTGSRERQPRPR